VVQQYDPGRTSSDRCRAGELAEIWATRIGRHRRTLQARRLNRLGRKPSILLAAGPQFEPTCPQTGRVNSRWLRAPDLNLRLLGPTLQIACAVAAGGGARPRFRRSSAASSSQRTRTTRHGVISRRPGWQVVIEIGIDLRALLARLRVLVHGIMPAVTETHPGPAAWLGRASPSAAAAPRT
jgi:hypothetical protein